MTLHREPDEATVNSPASSRGIEPHQYRNECVYRCPGERGAISRAVHLGRLSAGYAACRDCEHRHDLGALPLSTFPPGPHGTGFQNSPQNDCSSSVPASQDSLCGILHNQITRPLTEQYVARFVDIQSGHLRQSAPSRTRPTLVVGQDGGTCIPELLTWIVPQLRRAGAAVIDVGSLPRPGWQFAVQHLRATGGLYLSGDSSYSRLSGDTRSSLPGLVSLSFCGDQGEPWSSPGRLVSLQEVPEAADTVRWSRIAGSYRTFEAVTPWLTGLQKHFLSPRRILLAASEVFHRTLLAGPQFPGAQIVAWEGPAVQQIESRHFGQSVVSQDADLGLVVHPDDQTVTAFASSGQQIPAETLAVRLIEQVGTRVARPTVVCSSADFGQLRARLAAGRVRVLDGGDTTESCALRMIEEQADCGVDPNSRFWLRDPHVSCDALVTLSLILQCPVNAG